VGAAGQADFGETAGRGAKVEDDTVCWVKLKVVKGSDQFQGAAGHPGQVLTQEIEGGVGSYFFTCLADFRAIDADPMLVDQALGSGAAGNQSAVDKESVEPDGIHQFQPRRSA